MADLVTYSFNHLYAPTNCLEQSINVNVDLIMPGEVLIICINCFLAVFLVTAQHWIATLL